MKKSILITAFLVASIVCSNVTAQITGVGAPTGISLPKKECDMNLKQREISIFGNNTKNYTLINKNDPFYSFSDYSFTFRKTGGKARATFTIFIDGIQDTEWTFNGSISTGVKTIDFDNVNGKTVTLKVKNHSATNKIEGNYQGTIKTNSMFIGPKKSNETIIERITQSFEQSLNMPCNNKATIEITRLSGISSAEIVVMRGNNVLKTVAMSATETSKKINLNNMGSNSGELKLIIRNIQTGKFIRARIGAWFN